MVKKNEDYIVTIDGYTSEGNGIGRIDGYAVFVPYTMLGETVKIKIVKAKKTYAFGKLLEVINASPSRIEPSCSVFGKCGGCQMQHMNYEAELEYKQQKVNDALFKIGGLDLKVSEVLSADDAYGYRNKVSLPIRKNLSSDLVCGFYAKNSHRVVEYDTCHIQDPVLEHIAKEIIDFIKKEEYEPYDEEKGHLRHLYIRRAESTGEVMVCIVVSEKKDLSNLVTFIKGIDENIVSIVENLNTLKSNLILGNKITLLSGKDFITEKIGDISFEISPLAFLQVNYKQMLELYETAISFSGVMPNDTVLDLFCGIGTLSLLFAQRAKYVYGVEIVQQAIINAKQNAHNNSVTNAEFFVGDTKDIIEQFKNTKIDIVVLDPPRQGCAESTIRAIAEQIKPQKIVYVSCDPGTLARDLKLFLEKGYLAQKIKCVDMFPRTKHVECCVLMSRNI